MHGVEILIATVNMVAAIIIAIVELIRLYKDK